MSEWRLLTSSKDLILQLAAQSGAAPKPQGPGLPAACFYRQDREGHGQVVAVAIEYSLWPCSQCGAVGLLSAMFV